MINHVDQGRFLETSERLALHTIAKEYGFKVYDNLTNHNGPDFILSKNGIRLSIETKNCGHHYKIGEPWLERFIYDKIRGKKFSKNFVVGSFNLTCGARKQLRRKNISIYDYGMPILSRKDEVKFLKWLVKVIKQILLSITFNAMHKLIHLTDTFPSHIHMFLGFPRMIFAAIPRFLRISVTTSSTR